MNTEDTEFYYNRREKLDTERNKCLRDIADRVGWVAVWVFCVALSTCNGGL